MALVRISSSPAKSKKDAYLQHDISRKAKKRLLIIRILSVLLLSSIIGNIILYLK
jgi:hypothetical protein